MNMSLCLAGCHQTPMKGGQSGADVYDVDGKYVLKRVIRHKLEEALFRAYAREAQFYQAQSSRRPAYLPEVLETEISENEILILMKKYDQPARRSLCPALVDQIAQSLAAVHTDDPPPFLRCDRQTAELLSDERIAACLAGWNSVLAEHPGAFDASPLEKIADLINRVILWHDSEERVLAHGDFHWDNLLKDGHDHMLLCDWQAVHHGSPSGDLSFFLSRLSSEGVQLDAEAFLDAYAAAVRARSGKSVDHQETLRHIHAATIITSFVCWHEYLHGNNEKRVQDVYWKMTEAFAQWDSL